VGELALSQTDEQQPQTTNSPTSEAEEARRRLNNLGYSSPDGLEDKIRAFQHDCGEAPTGALDDAKAQIATRHDQLTPPSPGKLRTLV